MSPHWMHELHSNLAMFSAYGGMSDPGLSSVGAHGLDMLVNLQVAISFFWDDPRIYNAASYLVFALLLLVWVYVTLRSHPSPARTWLALAAIAALSMLPVYHRQHDAKLLLLTVPACAMLWAEGGLTGRLALLVTTAGFVLNGDFFWVIVLDFISRLHLPATALTRQVVIAVQVFPAPLILLVMSVFYLWVYVRSCSVHAPSQPL